MGLPSRRRIKKELNRRLLYYPLLPMLLFKVWFRVAFMCALVTAILLGLYLPKIWRTSPDEFNPVIRVSALDLTQAWSLKRSAKKAQANGDYTRAYLSWQSAVAQNPADPKALRGFLSNFLNLKNPDQRQVHAAIGQSFWLLRLGGTNEMDVGFCSKIYEKFRWHDVMLHAFKPIEKDLKGPAEVAYLKALFHNGRMSEFAHRLHEMTGAEDAELPLYRLALDAGWARGPEALDAHAKLTRAAESGSQMALATRLLMAAAEKRGNVEAYRECLERLSRSNEASISDQTKYWALLAANGRKSEAIQLAEQFTSSPTSAMEVLRLAQIYFKLDLVEQCREVLKEFAPQFGQSPEVWTSYGTVLEGLEEWNEMRAAALRIREQPNYYENLGGYSHYLEGRAELGQERRTTAEIAFRKASQATYEAASVGTLVADGLLKVNYPQYARPVLEQLEAGKEDDDEYWELVFRAAHDLKGNLRLLLRRCSQTPVWKTWPSCSRASPANRRRGRTSFALAWAGRRTFAEIAFRKASQATYEAASVGTLVADGLLKVNYPQYARPVLEQLEAGKEDDDEYWELVFRAAHDLKDAEWLLKAAKKAYTKDPRDVVVANRYAAALMANRAEPDEAVHLTLRILNSYPRSNTAAINHALALLLNKRTSEARAELRQIVPAMLSPHETPAYYLALFEACMNEQAYSEARDCLEKIPVSQLFPPQRRWLDEQIKLFPPTVTSVLP